MNNILDQLKNIQKYIKNHPGRISVIFLAILIVTSVIMDFSSRVIQERKDRAIVNYCEEYRWNDRLRPQDEEQWNADGRRLIGQSDFLCSEHLYLKPKVKKSDSGICHGEGSTYYYRTKNYKAFNTVQDCISSGGRLPYN